MSVVHSIRKLCPKCKNAFLVFVDTEVLEDGTICYVYRCPKCGYEEKTCVKITYSVSVG